MNYTQLSVVDVVFQGLTATFGFFGVLGNFIVIFIALKLPRASYSWFIISMAVADTMTVANNMILQVAYAFSK